METINHVLLFLNRLDFVADLESGDYKNFNCIQKVLTDEFQDVNSEKLINMLGVLDDLHVLFLTQDFEDVQTLTKVSHDDTFLLLRKKCKMNKLSSFTVVLYVINQLILSNGCESKRKI